jgi:hypothetical protein
MSENLLTQAIELVGLARLASELEVTYQAIRKWEKAGRLPRTEWTGETNYGAVIEKLTEGKVRKSALLGSRKAVRGARQALEPTA